MASNIEELPELPRRSQDGNGRRGLKPTVHLDAGRDGRIGDALSTHRDGVISSANGMAEAKGVRLGMRASEAARLMLS